jgi:hypothetical protein
MKHICTIIPSDISVLDNIVYKPITVISKCENIAHSCRYLDGITIGLSFLKEDFSDIPTFRISIPQLTEVHTFGGDLNGY